MQQESQRGREQRNRFAKEERRKDLETALESRGKKINAHIVAKSTIEYSAEIKKISNNVCTNAN